MFISEIGQGNGKVVDCEDCVKVIFDVAGYLEDELEVSLIGDKKIRVKAHSNSRNRKLNKSTYLPFEISDEDELEATFNNGILSIKIPKN